MSQGFSHIMTLSCMHHYFSNLLFSAVDISYSDRTKKLMRDLNIVLKPTENGFLFAASEMQLLENHQGDYPIQVYLSITDPYYINYTDLDGFDPRNSICYFNNLGSNWKEKDRSFQLHESDFVANEVFATLSNGSFQLSNFQESGSYVFKDAMGVEISKNNIVASSASDGSFQIYNLTEGIIQVFEGANLVELFYFIPSAVSKKPFAVVEIYPAQLFTHYKARELASYTIQFNNRYTKWKYFFMGDVYQNFDDLSIINKNKENQFGTPERVQILDNTKSLVFESKNYLPLTEHSTNNFQLIDNFDEAMRSGKVVVKKLPHPTPQQLHRDDSMDAKTMYSQIFIY